ncbi:unnamed protein product [Heterobilharzia americana]|nr:unnamed protein product [Heterobilharzia americana]
MLFWVHHNCGTRLYKVKINTSSNCFKKIFIHISSRQYFLLVVPALSSKLETQFPIELYSTNRVINLCGIIIDNNLGCSWTLCLDNSVVPKLIDNHNLVVDFILHRFNGKSVLLDYFCELVATSVKEVIWMTDKPLDYTFNGCGLNQRLDQFAFIFKRICEVCYPTKVDANRLHTDSNKFNTNSFDKGSYRTSSRPHTLETSSQESLLVSSKCSIITQSEIFSHVFMKNQCMENLEVRKFFCSLLIEYIRIMLDHNVHIEHCFYELLVSLIARIGNYMQFGYYIQSRLLADSKPVALQLLSLESVYPAAGQLAIDMLKRTNTFNDELFDALLIKRRSLEALRFSRLQYPSYAVDTENICNFLNTTQKDQDFLQFYCAYHFLKEEGLNWKDLFKHTDGPYRCLVEHYIDRSY